MASKDCYENQCDLRPYPEEFRFKPWALPDVQRVSAKVFKLMLEKKMQKGEDGPMTTWRCTKVCCKAKNEQRHAVSKPVFLPARG